MALPRHPVHQLEQLPPPGREPVEVLERTADRLRARRRDQAERSQLAGVVGDASEGDLRLDAVDELGGAQRAVASELLEYLESRGVGQRSEGGRDALELAMVGRERHLTPPRRRAGGGL